MAVGIDRGLSQSWHRALGPLRLVLKKVHIAQFQGPVVTRFDLLFPAPADDCTASRLRVSVALVDEDDADSGGDVAALLVGGDLQEILSVSIASSSSKITISEEAEDGDRLLF